MTRNIQMVYCFIKFDGLKVLHEDLVFYVTTDLNDEDVILAGSMKDHIIIRGFDPVSLRELVIKQNSKMNYYNCVIEKFDMLVAEGWEFSNWHINKLMDG